MPPLITRLLIHPDQVACPVWDVRPVAAAVFRHVTEKDAGRTPEKGSPPPPSWRCQPGTASPGRSREPASRKELLMLVLSRRPDEKVVFPEFNITVEVLAVTPVNGDAAFPPPPAVAVAGR